MKRGLEALLAPCDNITGTNTVNRDEADKVHPSGEKEPETMALKQELPHVARGRSYAQRGSSFQVEAPNHENFL